MGQTIRHSIILGFALFALYFGAGNLIFPPSIGNMTGTDWIPALVGFCITGIVLPLLAVIAILNANGKFEELTRPISPWFYVVFNLALMVGIGMFVTIPRMAATTHELGVGILFPQVPQIVTIVLFFAVSFYFAMDKSNVIDKIGKILTPLLVIILLFIVGKGIFSPIGTPVDTGSKAPFSDAFISAYQTGDVVTGILCAPIFIAAIVGYGYKGRQVRKIALIGTGIAGLGLLIVYGGLLFIGAGGSSVFPATIDSTTLVSEIVQRLLGNFGSIALAIAVALACLTSTIGVMAVIADFLHKLSREKISYRVWVFIISIVGIGVGSLGVEKIVDYAMPIFTVLYPVAIVLVFLGVFNKIIPNAGGYRGAILFTILVSTFETITAHHIHIPFISKAVGKLPFSENGFAWLVPSLVGFVAGLVLQQIFSKKPVQAAAVAEADKDVETE
ncbi:LIVCS family branched-chain amino acid:cation transporter [Sporosarcina luteola]|nr:LIVCS family branched-chain amino acid:cation transporter [Sporosarcina luteola]